MSTAIECDRCGTLCARAPGLLSLDLCRATDDQGTLATWADIELCGGCSEELAIWIKPAIQDDDPDGVSA